MIQLETLDVNTRLIMETVDSTDTVSVGFWFLSGSRDELKGRQGFTHVLEHMLFKGTSRRTAFQIAREIDRVGGTINAFTDKENCCYYCTLPGEYLILALDILTDMLFHSCLDGVELSKEKTVILNEITASLDAPEELAHELFLEQLWPDHPLALKITGEIEDVKAVSEESLQSFYREQFLTAPLIITIAGSFKFREAADFIKSKLPSGKRQHPSRSKPEPDYGHAYIKNRFVQVQIYAGTQLPPLQKLEDYYCLLILSTIVGEALSSRLFQRIREELGLCYSIYSFRGVYSDTALWQIYANTSPFFVPALLDTINTEMVSLLKDRISAEELAAAKSHLKGHLVLSREDMESRMKRLARLELMAGVMIEYEDSFHYIDEVSLEHLNEYIGQVFSGDRFRLLTYGSRKTNTWKGFRFTF